MSASGPKRALHFSNCSVRVSTSQTRNVYQDLTIRVRTPFGRYIQEKSIASLAALPLAGCQSGEKAKVRYRMIAWLEVDGKPFQASTVMEIHYARVTNSLTGAGGATRLYGEALIADIPGKGTVYLLPVKA
jgi:hypothetical protein